MSPGSAVGPVRVVPVDPDDAPGFEAWNDVLTRGERHGRERYATPWMPGEMRERLRSPEAGTKMEAWALVEGPPGEGAVRASALLEWRTTDNLDRVDARVMTDPAVRGQGHGSHLLDAVVERCRALGRSRLGADAWWPIAAGTDGEGTVGADFLRRRGFELGISEVLRVLPLPVPAERLDALAAEAAVHHGAYRIEAFAGRVPEEWAQAWGALAGSLEVEAPTGGIEIEAHASGAAEVRSEEEVMARQGRTPHRAVALDADGALVAYTEVVSTEHEPHRAYQWGTLVRPDHRGHRLGMAVKVAALRQLVEHAPQVREVLTWNAEVNGPMIAVNEQLGYRAVERAGWFERRLDRPPS